jgi:predicted dehydrogenase
MQLEEFVAAIREEREPRPNGFDGLQTVRMTEAVYRSASCGDAQPIETQAPAPAAVSGV